MSQAMTSSAAVSELSARLKRIRIDYPMTQKELSERSGISLRSISRFESGGDIQLTNFIKILRALGLDENLDLLIPDSTKRPSYYLNQEKLRKRASSTGTKRRKNPSWKWGDEQ